VPGNYERQTVSGWRKRLLTDTEYRHLVLTLRNQGIAYLENHFIQLTVNHRNVRIFGFDNSIYGNERFDEMHLKRQSDEYVIFLAHSPSIIRLIEQDQLAYHLLLVGHTHGGQARLLGRTIGAYKHFHVG